MEVFFLLPILAIACCGLPLLILEVVALFNRGRPDYGKYLQLGPSHKSPKKSNILSEDS